MQNLLNLKYLNISFCCFQNSVIEWSRDHRVHHKHVETNADPHNSNRGFFFSHMVFSMLILLSKKSQFRYNSIFDLKGWLMCKKHVDVIEKGRKISVDDLSSDPLLRFQQK